MSRYRLLPSLAQEAVLRNHCAHARYVWNLAVEQYQHWRPGRASAPRYLEQSRQLTEARAEHDWLRAGSQTVQQQALRDFAQAMAAFCDPGNPAGRPSWRKAGRNAPDCEWLESSTLRAEEDVKRSRGRARVSRSDQGAIKLLPPSGA